jgi:2-C-methyl-D-erythritol 2,4-cyclodiphosphate synthase
MLNFRVGIGVDHHVLEEKARNSQGKALTLGGVEISGQKVCLESNCDGDVVIHALCNALSTAVGGGSLAPVTDPMCEKEGIKDSEHYLAYFVNLVREKNYQVNNISVSVEAAKPKLEAWGDRIAEGLAKRCGMAREAVGIAFTTGEGLTACGRGEGIYAQVVVSLVNAKKGAE